VNSDRHFLGAQATGWGQVSKQAINWKERTLTDRLSGSDTGLPPNSDSV